MKIGEIGNFFKSTQKIDYLSTQSILEYDALIVDFNNLLSRYDIHNEQHYRKRKKNFEEFVNFKKMPLIIFVPMGRDPWQLVIGGFLKLVSYDSFAPIPNLSIENENGTQWNPKTSLI